MCNPFTWKRGIGIAALLSWGIISADAQDLCPVADSPFERIRLAGAVPTDRPELAVQQLSCAYNESLSGGHAVIASAAAYLLGKAYETQGDNQFALRQYENGLQALTGSGRTAAVSVEELLIRIEGSAKGIPSSTGTSGAMDLYRGDVGDIEAWFGEFPETRAGTMSLALTTNAGNMYLLQSQHAQAKDYFQQALNTAQLLDDQLAIVGISSNLAWNAIRNERYEDAKTHLDRALQNAPADHRTALRRALLAVGVNTREQRRPDAALSSIQESIDLYREAGDRNGLAGALAHLGTTYHVLENYPAAEIAYLEAGFLNRSRGDNAIARHINGGLALTYHAMGDLERAQHRYEMYFIALDEFLTSFGTDEGRVGILENQQALFRDFVDVALQVAQDSGDYTVARRAAERGRAPVLPDLMRSKQGAPQRQPGFVPAGQFLLGEDLDHVLHGLGGETDMAANPMQMAISVPVQTAPGIPVGDSRLPGEPFPPDGGDAVPPTGAPEVDQPILPRVEPPTFLEYYVTDQRTLVSLIRPDGSLTGAVIDIGSTALAAVIDDFLVAMNVASPRGVEVRGVTPVTGPRAVDAANIDELALRLHDLLIKPIENDLPVDPADHVVIVPHGALWRLPFATLRDGQGAYINTRHALSYIPSSDAWTLMADKPRKADHRQPRAWIVGNPVMPSEFERCNVELSLGPLAGAEAEAREISRLFGDDAEVFIGPQADRLRLEAWHPDYSVLHLATHGLACAGDPLESFIVLTALDSEEFAFDPELGHLARTADPRLPVRLEGMEQMWTGPGQPPFFPHTNDGLLEARSVISNFQLNADLVTLSACQTGLGRLSGEGMIGFTRAFLAAGSRSLLVSLWKVDDAATRDLMVHFYEGYLAHGDKSRALRDAMEHTREKFPDPGNWAAFTLVGLAE